MIEAKHFAEVAQAIISNSAYQAIKYISPKEVLKVTRQFKFSAKNSRNGFVFTMGRPAVREAAKIKQYQKAGVAFPVRNIELRFKTYKK